MLYEKTITRAMFERSSDFLDVAARRARKFLRLGSTGLSVPQHSAEAKGAGCDGWRLVSCSSRRA